MCQMKKKLWKLILTAALAAFLAAPCVLAAESNTVTVKATVQYGQSEARDMLSMVNDFRTGSEAWAWNRDNTTKTWYSSQKLTYDYDLEKTAMLRAAEIAFSFSHTRPNGTICFTTYSTGSSYGENIAAGYTTAAAAFKGWQETNDDYSGQGHRRNMLNSGYTAIGIGHVYYNGCHYWVQEFRSPVVDTTLTAANNAETEVELEILESNIIASDMSALPQTCAITWQETTALPEVTVKIKVADSWPSTWKSVLVPCTWSLSDETCASISDGRLIGKKRGSTALTTTVLGKTVNIPVTVNPVSVENAVVAIEQESYDYNGKTICPAVSSVALGGKVLSESDYTVSYENNLSPGTAKVVIAGKNDYTGTAVKQFTIKGPAKGTVGTSGNAAYMVVSPAEESGTVTLTAASAKTLTSVNIPDTVKIQGVPFKVTAISPKAFRNCKKLKTVTIGKNVKEIGAQAFENCTSLTKVNGCSNIAEIGSKAFYKCIRLVTLGNAKNVITLSKAEVIGSSAFYGCKAIKKVNVSSSALKNINTAAFQNCTAMTSFTAKSTKLSSIGSKAFCGDKKLSSITLKTTKLTKSKVGSNAFKGIKSTCKIKVPSSKVKTYQSIFKVKGAGSKVNVTK